MGDDAILKLRVMCEQSVLAEMFLFQELGERFSREPQARLFVSICVRHTDNISRRVFSVSHSPYFFDVCF
jgi:hypothetical protein